MGIFIILGFIYRGGSQISMQRVAIRNGTQQGRTKRRIIVGSLLLLCILCAGGAAVWFDHRASSSTPASQTNAVVRYKGHRSSEVPVSTNRMLSMMDAHSPTSSMPWNIALDPTHGYTWVAEPGCEPLPKCPTSFPSVIGQYSYADGAFIQDFTEPQGYTSPFFVVIDSVGHLWFTQPNSDAIGEFDPTNNVWQQWPVTKNTQPYALAIDAHDNIWFTEFSGSQIGFLNTKTHKIVETPTPTPHSDPYGITITSNGVGWFAENRNAVSQIGSFTATTNGKIAIAEHPVNALRPHLITTDAAGNVWFSEGFEGYIGEYNPATGTNRRYPVYLSYCVSALVCPATHISSVHADNNGNVWFTDSLNQKVGYLVPATGQVVSRTLPPNSHPHDGLTLDKNGRVWFTEQDTLTLNMWSMNSVK